MTLITAIIGGLACGYFLGMRKAFLVWLPVWAVVLSLQSAFFFESIFSVDPENRDDPSYWPVQAAILVVAMVMIWLGVRLRARRARRLVRN